MWPYNSHHPAHLTRQLPAINYAQTAQLLLVRRAIVLTGSWLRVGTGMTRGCCKWLMSYWEARQHQPTEIPEGFLIRVADR